MRYLLSVFINGKWIVLSAVLVSIAAAMTGNHFQSLRYQSWAQVQIDAPPFLPSPGTDVNSQSIYYSNVDKYFRTEKEKLNSRRLQTLFAEELKQQDPYYSAVPVESITRQLDGAIRTEAVEGTNLVFVFLTADNPDKAAYWLNRYLDVFVEDNSRQQEERVTQSREALLRQMDDIKKLLESQRLQMSALMETPGVPAGLGNGVSEGELLRYRSAYEQARQSRVFTEQKLGRLQRCLDSDSELAAMSAADIPPNVQGYFQVMRDATAALENLRLEGRSEEYPAVLARKAQIEDLKERIRVELQKTAASLRTGLVALKTAEQSAEQRYASRTAEQKPGLQIQEPSGLDKMRENWTIASSLVEEKLRSLNVLESFVAHNISVVERARPESVPLSKRGLAFVFLVGAAGGVLGLGLVVAKEFLNPKVTTVEEIQSSFNVPALGFLPRATDFSLNEIRESYNVLRTEILFRRDTYQHRSIMVTSSIPREGKTTVTMNLAKTLAAAGDRTVVLDFDLRKARLRSLMSGNARKGNMVFTPVQGLDLRLEPTQTRTLHLIVPATLPRNPPYLLSQPEFREMIDFLRGRYDWVLIDTPPVTSVTDPVIVAGMVDTILFVIKHNFADKRLVRNSLASLRNVNGHIMGAVLNDLDVKRLSYYSYQSYYRYYSDAGTN